MGNGRLIGEALRHLDQHGAEPGAPAVARALAYFLVPRCESHHAGWRVLRKVVIESGADVPWERCARRAVSPVTEDLLLLSVEAGRTPLSRAQHVAAQRRAEQIARHVDRAALLKDLGLAAGQPVEPERWEAALREAVTARSREQVARAVGSVLADLEDEDEDEDGDGDEGAVLDGAAEADPSSAEGLAE